MDAYRTLEDDVRLSGLLTHDHRVEAIKKIYLLEVERCICQFFLKQQYLNTINDFYGCFGFPLPLRQNFKIFVQIFCLSVLL